MTKLHYIFTVSLMFFFMLSGCNKNDDLTGVQMSYRYQFEVPAGLNPLNTHFFERSGMLTNASNLLGDVDAINRIIPYQARITSLDNIDFAFVQEIEVRVKDPDNPGLEIPAFYREEVPNNAGRTIDLIATQADVTNIINRDQYNIIVELRLKGTTGITFESDIQLSFLAQ